MVRISKSTALFLVVAALTLSGAATLQAQEIDTRATGSFVALTNVMLESGCTDILVGVYVRTSGTQHLVVTLVHDNQIVTDNTVTLAFPDGTSAFTSTNYANDRGRAPVNVWPLAPGKKVFVFLTLFTTDWQPVYEARGVLKSCEKLTFKSNTHGPAYQLMENHSFEAPGQTDGFVDAERPAHWKLIGANNDARVCDSVRAGSSVYHGSCGFLYIAEPSVATKVKQSYNGTIGAAGDTVYLNGHAQSFLGYSGGAKLKARLTFADGTSNTLSLTFPSGEHLWPTFPNAYPYEAFLVMPASLISAKVTIQQKFGTGNLAVDVITLSVFTNTNTSIRALPLPLAPEARDAIDLGKA